jgi:Mg/Co/Ni transporter MgtE
MSKYDIYDLEMFVQKTRVLVYNSFGTSSKPIDEIDMDFENLNKDQQKEIDNCLSEKEALNIVLEHVLQKRDRDGNIINLLSEENFMAIINDFSLRMTSNILNTLASKGLVDSAFDEETNDFVFWAKDLDDENEDKNNKT